MVGSSVGYVWEKYTISVVGSSVGYVWVFRQLRFLQTSSDIQTVTIFTRA